MSNKRKSGVILKDKKIDNSSLDTGKKFYKKNKSKNINIEKAPIYKNNHLIL